VMRYGVLEPQLYLLSVLCLMTLLTSFKFLISFEVKIDFALRTVFLFTLFGTFDCLLNCFGVSFTRFNKL